MIHKFTPPRIWEPSNVRKFVFDETARSKPKYLTAIGLHPLAMSDMLRCLYESNEQEEPVVIDNPIPAWSIGQFKNVWLYRNPHLMLDQYECMYNGAAPAHVLVGEQHFTGTECVNQKAAAESRDAAMKAKLRRDYERAFTPKAQVAAANQYDAEMNLRYGGVLAPSRLDQIKMESDKYFASVGLESAADDGLMHPLPKSKADAADLARLQSAADGKMCPVTLNSISASTARHPGYPDTEPRRTFKGDNAAPVDSRDADGKTYRDRGSQL